MTTAGRVDTADVVVVGGGIVGYTVALELRRRLVAPRVVILEKEPRPFQHASGRNSGVLHAGFYYGADSLKARFCRDGNRAWTEYCTERSLPINPCGKLVVASGPSEVAGIDELFRRGRANGVDVRVISEAEAREIDASVRTVDRALWSPTTSSVDPTSVGASLVDDARALGIELRTSTPFLSARGTDVRTPHGTLSAGYVVNAAGLYADQVARAWGFSQHHTILPFKGLYLISSTAVAPRVHVYPVPDLRMPFLGVHFTVTAAGAVKIGPTAIPALWREHYGGLSGFRARELIDVGTQGARLFLSDTFHFRRLALQEVRKHSKRRLVDLARRFVHGSLSPRDWRWARPGIRAQLLDVRTRSLEMDFRIEGDERSMHVLNAVSPAFTSALPFAAYVVDEIERRLGHSPGPAASPSGP